MGDCSESPQQFPQGGSQALLHARSNRIAPAPLLRWKSGDNVDYGFDYGGKTEDKWNDEPMWRGDREKADGASPLAAIAQDRDANVAKISRSLRFTGKTRSDAGTESKQSVLHLRLMTDGTVRGELEHDTGKSVQRVGGGYEYRGTIVRGRWTSERRVTFTLRDSSANGDVEYTGSMDSAYLELVGKWKSETQTGSRYRGTFKFTTDGLIKKSTSQSSLMDVAEEVGFNVVKEENASSLLGSIAADEVRRRTAS